MCVTRPQGVCGRLDNVEVTRLSDGKSVKWVQGARPWDPEALVQIADRAFKFGVLFTRPTIATDVVVRRTPAKPAKKNG